MGNPAKQRQNQPRRYYHSIDLNPTMTYKSLCFKEKDQNLYQQNMKVQEVLWFVKNEMEVMQKARI